MMSESTIERTVLRRTRRSRMLWIALAAAIAAAVPATAGAQPEDDVATAPPPVPASDDNYVTTTTATQRSLDLSAFSPSCVRDAPFISYTIVPVGFSSIGPATLTFFDVNGNFIEQQTVSTLSGRVIYPGATTDAAGSATGWPGWTLAPDGSWIPDPSDAIFREGLTVQVEVDGVTAATTVAYPPADSGCANPPNVVLPTTTVVGPCVPGQNNDADPTDDCDLATTGGGPGNALITGAAALMAGVLFLTAARRRRHGPTPST